MTKTPASNTVKELSGYPVQNSLSGNYSWGGAVGRVEIVYDIVWMGCLRRTPWTELRTPVCSYPIDVFHLSFNFLCVLLLYSIYLCGRPPWQCSQLCIKPALACNTAIITALAHILGKPALYSYITEKAHLRCNWISPLLYCLLTQPVRIASKFA